MGSSTFLRMVALGSRLYCWKTKPTFSLRMAARSAAERFSACRPSSAEVAPVGTSRQPRMAISVLLPDPEGPIRATNSPRSTSRSMPHRAWTALPLLPYVLIRPRVSMIFMTASVVLVVLLDLLAGHVLERHLIAGAQAGHDLDPLERRDAGVDRDRLEVVLPVLGEPHELAAAVETLARLLDLLGIELRLQA